MARKAGQIIARGAGTWLVRVYLGRDSQTGTRKYHNQTIHGPFREAQRFLNLRLQQRDNGRVSRAAVLSLNQLLDQWLSTVVKGASQDENVSRLRSASTVEHPPSARQQTHRYDYSNRHAKPVCTNVRARIVGTHDRVHQRRPPIGFSPGSPLEDAG
jgi:hypothetical protein